MLNLYWQQSLLGSDRFGGRKSGKTMLTVSSRTRRLHPKQGNASKSRDDHEKTIKKRKVTVEKGTEDEKQQVL